MADKLKLPVGIEDFREIRRKDFYYIDKTRLIEQLLEIFVRNIWESSQLCLLPLKVWMD